MVPPEVPIRMPPRAFIASDVTGFHGIYPVRDMSVVQTSSNPTFGQPPVKRKAHLTGRLMEVAVVPDVPQTPLFSGLASTFGPPDILVPPETGGHSTKTRQDDTRNICHERGDGFGGEHNRSDS